MLKSSISRPDCLYCFAWCVLVLCLSCSLRSPSLDTYPSACLSLSLCIVSASVCAVPGLMSSLIPQYSTYLVDTLWKLAFRSARCKSWRTSVAFKRLKSCTVDMIRNMTEPQQNDMEDHGRTINMQSVDVYWISVDICWSCHYHPLPCGWGSLLMSLPFPVDLIIEILHALPAVSSRKGGMLQIMAIKFIKNGEHDDKPKDLGFSWVFQTFLFMASWCFMVSSRMGKTIFPTTSDFEIMKS